MADPTTSSTRTHVAHLESVVPSLTHTLKDYPGDRSRTPPRLFEEQVNRISELLAQAGKKPWSRIPRTYAVLHMMDKVENIEAFIQEQISDLWFPFTVRTLPDGLLIPADQYVFLELQDFVLSNASDLQREDNTHRHFAKSSEVPFVKQEEPGKDGLGHADRVISTISHKEYARALIRRGKTFRKNATARRDFERELESLKKLRHEHIVQFVGSYTDPKHVVILMAPVAEMNLEGFLARDSLTRAQLSLLRTFYGCLAVSLQYLHGHQVSHGQIKPQNILVKDHQVILTGFGLSLDDSLSGQSTTTDRDPSKTERYRAPEVSNNLPRNTLADVWSLGCVFLEIWTVLKGESVVNLTNHLTSFRNRSTCYYQNSEAIVAWYNILQVRGSTTDENRPLTWIQGALSSDQHHRWTAEQLVTTLTDADDAQENSLLFIGNCCSHLDDDSTTSSVSSRRASHVLEETSIFGIKVDEPNPKAREHNPSPQDPAHRPSTPTPRFIPLSPPQQGLDSSLARHSTSSTVTSSPENRLTAEAASNRSWVTSHPPSVAMSLSPPVSPIKSDIELFTEQFATLDSVSRSQLPQRDLSMTSRLCESRAYEPSSSNGIECVSPGSVTAQRHRPGMETYHIGVLEGHKNSVLSIAFSSDGTVIASGSGDHTVRIWNAFTGRQVRMLEGHTDWIRSVVFSPDDTTITSGSDDGAVKTWAVSTGALVRRLEGQKNWVKRVVSLEEKGWVTSVALSPNGTTIALGSADHTVRIWNVFTGKQLRKLVGHRGRVWSVAFSPDGSVLASGSEDQLVRTWDVATGRQTRRFEGHKHWVNSVVFSPNGTIIASGSQDKTVWTWNAATGRPMQTLEGHTGPVTSVAFSPDGTTIASGSFDMTARTWNAFTGRLIRQLVGHTGRIWSVAFSPDGTTIASGSDDRTIKTWNIGRVVSELIG